MSSETSTSCPYVGLRPFQSHESYVFFGRDEQTTELLEQLHRSHFLAVVGSSGSGKSSLVRAGLIPALTGGFLVESRDRWQVATMKPGDAPLRNLARALSKAWEDAETASTSLHNGIEENHTEALLEYLRPRLDEAKTNLLLVVDQFEEIFHYCGQESEEELETMSADERRERVRRRGKAARFVELTLELAATADRMDLPIFTVLTMRSDFLGDCDLFYGLPEAMNRSQYLVPRLRRRQARQAIEGPARLFGARIALRLLDRLLNELGDRADRLPVLQHALLRTWNAWERGGRKGEIDLDHYRAIGKLQGAITLHGDEVLRGEDTETTARIFKCLTDTDPNHRRVRRPSSLGEMVALSGGEENVVEKIVARFSTKGCDFLARSGTSGSGERIEISHESLIRQWSRLRAWVDEERASRDLFRDLADRAHKWESQEEALLRDPGLTATRDWWRDTRPTVDWAERHGKNENDHRLAWRYLQKSHEEADREAKRTRWRRWGWGLLFLVMLIVGTVFFWAERLRRINATRSLEIRAEVVMSGGADQLQRSTLIAAETIRRVQDLGIVSLAADHVLHGGLALLPVPVTRALNHGDRVELMALSHDGMYVATASGDKKVHLWQTADGRKTFETEYDKKVVGVALSPDGRYLATAGTDKTARLLDVNDGREIRRIDHEEKGVVLAVAFSSRGTYLATASKEIGLLHLETGTQTWLRAHAADVVSLTFSPDESYLASASDDGTVRLWQTASGEEEALLEHPHPVTQAAFSRDGAYLAVVSDKTAYVWDLASSEVMTRLNHDTSVWAIAFNQGPGATARTQLATASFRTARLWDAVTGREIQHLNHEDVVSTLAFSPDGLYIATGSHDRTARVWHTATGQEVMRVIHNKIVSHVAFNGDGEYLATGSFDASARVWFAPSGLRTGPLFHEGQVEDVTFARQGRLLASASHDRTVRLWSVPGETSGPPPKRELVRTFGHPATVVAAAFSPDGQSLATGSRDNAVRLWDVSTGREATRLEHDKSIEAVVFNSDGSWLATASHDHTARVWNVATGEELSRIEHESAVFDVAFLPGTATLATASRDQVRLWEAQQLETSSIPLPTAGVLRAVAFSPGGEYLVAAGEAGAIHMWKVAQDWPALDRFPLISHEGAIYDLAFSTDGEYLASGGEYGAKVWKVSSGKQVAQISHRDDVRAVAFRPDGRYLATGSHDHTVRLWPLRPEDLIAESCARLTLELTPEGWRHYFGNEPYHEICPDR